MYLSAYLLMNLLIYWYIYLITYVCIYFLKFQVFCHLLNYLGLPRSYLPHQWFCSWTTKSIHLKLKIAKSVLMTRLDISRGGFFTRIVKNSELFLQIFDVLRDLVSKIDTPPWVFFTFFKLHKCYQIAQRTTYFHQRCLTEP